MCVRNFVAGQTFHLSAAFLVRRGGVNSREAMRKIQIVVYPQTRRAALIRSLLLFASWRNEDMKSGSFGSADISTPQRSFGKRRVAGNQVSSVPGASRIYIERLEAPCA